MTSKNRILIVLLAIVVLVGVVLGVDALRRRQTVNQADTVPPGSIPIYLDGELAGYFSPEDLAQLEVVSFTDAEEGKTQEGWLLVDVLSLHLGAGVLMPEADVIVSSSSRGKSAQLTWSEIADETNKVMFDLSGRGTLKLVSKLEKLDSRDEWVQDVDKLEIQIP